jgi:hypothetical protein
MTNLMHKFLFFCLFTSALHVSGFLLAHLQGQVYNFGSCSSYLGMFSAPGGADTIPRRLEPPASEDEQIESPKHVRQK